MFYGSPSLLAGCLSQLLRLIKRNVVLGLGEERGDESSCVLADPERKVNARRMLACCVHCRGVVTGIDTQQSRFPSLLSPWLEELWGARHRNARMCSLPCLLVVLPLCDSQPALPAAWCRGSQGA